MRKEGKDERKKKPRRKNGLKKMIRVERMKQERKENK
jgi:hypothetical protein